MSRGKQTKHIDTVVTALLLRVTRSHNVQTPKRLPTGARAKAKPRFLTPLQRTAGTRSTRLHSFTSMAKRGEGRGHAASLLLYPPPHRAAGEKKEECKDCEWKGHSCRGCGGSALHTSGTCRARGDTADDGSSDASPGSRVVTARVVTAQAITARARES